MTETHSPYSGVFAAVLTPQDANKDPDISRMTQHSQWLLANGCDGLAILGTTGEANSFGLKERIGIIEDLVAAGVPADRMMPGTGCCAIPDTVALTKAALDAGVKGVLMLPPFYYKNPSDDGLFAGFSEVIQRLGDDRLKIYIYHFPQMSAVPFSYDLIERFLKEYPETIVGMKDSSGDLENMAGAAEKFPGFAVFPGSDELLLPTLRRGGVGCITACANVVSAQAGALWQAWNAEGDGDTVAAMHEPLTAARNVITKYPLPPALKALMSRHTGDAGWLNLRPPLMELSEADKQALFAEFDGIGVTLPKAA